MDQLRTLLDATCDRLKAERDAAADRWQCRHCGFSTPSEDEMLTHDADEGHPMEDTAEES